MNRKNLFILIAVFGVVGVATAAYLLRPSAEATEPIVALPIEVSDPLPTNANDEVSENVEEPVIEPTDEASVSEEEITVDNSDGLAIFTIDQSASQVSFSIDEELRNAPFTAVGVTNQVAGEIGIDFKNPANSMLGVIQVNARTIETDNKFRNRAIANNILDTGKYEFITFSPTEIIGFPLTIEIGASYDLQIVGDLTIRDIIHSEIWNITITIVSASEIFGTGSTTVQRSNYNLIIPEVTQVANVSQDVILEINFSATK